MSYLLSLNQIKKMQLKYNRQLSLEVINKNFIELILLIAAIVFVIFLIEKLVFQVLKKIPN